MTIRSWQRTRSEDARRAGGTGVRRQERANKTARSQLFGRMPLTDENLSRPSGAPATDEHRRSHAVLLLDQLPLHAAGRRSAQKVHALPKTSSLHSDQAFAANPSTENHCQDATSGLEVSGGTQCNSRVRGIRQVPTDSSKFSPPKLTLRFISRAYFSACHLEAT